MLLINALAQILIYWEIEIYQFQILTNFVTWWRHRWCHECVKPNQLGCRFDILDSVSSSFCILTYANIYVLIHDTIFWLYLYFLNILYFFTYSWTNMRRECLERLPRHRLQRKPLVSDPGMHHGTCVTHVPCCMSGSLTRSGGKKRFWHSPSAGACATCNFAYLSRGPWKYLYIFVTPVQ